MDILIAVCGSGTCPVFPRAKEEIHRETDRTDRNGADVPLRRGVEACVAATRSTASLESALRHSDRVLVLEGCADCCRMKMMRAIGVEPHLHIIATDCGIEKNGTAEPRFDEIGCLTTAVLEAIRR